MVRVNPSPEQIEALYLQTAAYETQKDAEEQIRLQQKRVNEARADADAAIQHIKDEFQRQSIDEKDRNAQYLEKQRLQGYESLRNMQREQQSEVDRVRREGEKQVSDTHINTEQAVQSTETSAKKALAELQHKTQSEAEYTAKNAQNQLELEKKTHSLQMQQMQEHHQSTFEHLKAQTDKEYGRLKQNYVTASEQAKQDFENRYQGQVASNEQSLNSLNQLANQRLTQIRSDSSHKLAAYDSRQNDPFYKLVDANAQFVETNDDYKIVAKVPPQERGNVSVSVRGNEITLSGTRRNAENLEIAPGHVKQTHSYQTYSESFPISAQVEPKGIRKEFNGDTLTVTIPKRGRMQQAELFQAKRPEKSRIQTPQFPDNLPLEQKLKPIQEEAATQPSKPPGSGTLS